jgi:hypothetical protein
MPAYPVIVTVKKKREDVVDASSKVLWLKILRRHLTRDMRRCYLPGKEIEGLVEWCSASCSIRSWENLKILARLEEALLRDRRVPSGVEDVRRPVGISESRSYWMKFVNQNLMCESPNKRLPGETSRIPLMC